MDLLQKVGDCIKVLIGVAALIGSFFTVVNLMKFLSDPNIEVRKEVANENDWSIRVSWVLFKNMCLLSLFVFQHSFMADIRVKNVFHRLNLTDVQRSIYVIATCLCLQTLVSYWSTIPEVCLWRLNMESSPIWFLHLSAHIFSWLMIYVGTICLDVNELLGIKQIYYSLRNLPNPNSFKSMELQRFYAHMRHPSFLCFIVLFWFAPALTLDRLLLCGIVTTYMYLAWNPDELDYRYQEGQYSRKSYRLRCMN